MKKYSFDYAGSSFYIPERMWGGIERYVENGINPGDFLTAVICNDLKEAVGRADEENLVNLPAYVMYFYNEAPAACWGSAEKMKKWVACDGLRGLTMTAQIEREVCDV